MNRRITKAHKSSRKRKIAWRFPKTSIPKALTISGIRVDGLFGLYSYDLPAKSDNLLDLSKLIILYGDNGCGKTTILKLLFHLLTPQTKRGHKTFVAQTIFQNFVVKFSDNSEIIATRPKGKHLGAFTMSVRRSGKVILSAHCPVDQEGAVPGETSETKEFRKMLEYVKNLGISLFLLSDARTIEHDIELEKNEDPSVVDEMRLRKSDHESVQQRLLQSTIARTSGWIRTQVLKASNVGEENTHNIYLELVKHLAKLPDKPEASPIDSEPMVRSLQQIALRNEQFARFGLTSVFEVNELVSVIRKVSARNVSIVMHVTSPYLDGLTARLDALERIQMVLASFIDNLNDLFVNKRVVYTLANGFRFESKNGQLLDPWMLSSGEKHLFLLFCNSIIATDHQSIFIIDEPEISLNIKWQRRLIQVLLHLVEGAKVQYIFATHSLELLSQNMENVLRLSDDASSTKSA